MSRSAVQASLKSTRGWIAVAVAAVGLLTFGSLREGGPRTPQERVEAVAKRVACPVCDGESVFESRNNASAEIRIEIARQVDAAVLSDDEIVDYLVESFGTQVSLLPRSSGLDALVWMLPVGALVIASAGLGAAFVRWRRNAEQAATDDDLALVEAALSGTGIDGP